MATRNEYTETVRDLQAMLRKEADQNKRDRLGEDLKKMAEDLEKQRDGLVRLDVLVERVDGLVWLVRGVMVTVAMEIVVAVIVALLMKGAK